MTDVSRARQMLASGRHELARSEARRIHDRARSRCLRAETARLAVQIELERDEAAAAWLLLQEVPPEDSSVALEASVADACGQDTNACSWLETALLMGTLDADGLKLLLDIHVREGRSSRALELAREGAYLLTPDEQVQLARAVSSAPHAGA